MRLWYRVPEWECFDHDGGRGVFGRHGATQDQLVGDLGRGSRESAVAMEGFCRNAVGPPEWECEAMGSVMWVQCANLCRVCVKSIDSCVLDYKPSS